MKAINKIIAGIGLTLLSASLYAQQAPMYTHYMYNTLSVNPAYAGSRDALTVTALHRTQWANFNGAPVTQTLTLHTPLRNEHVGLGLSVLNDKIGPTNNTAIFGYYAYRFMLNQKSKLALGLSAGVNLYQADLTSLKLDQETDPVFINNIDNRTLPNFGFGAYYSRERFYAGVSVPNLLENNYSVENKPNGEGSSIGKEQRHYFFVAGTLFKLSENLDFKPSTMIKVTEAAPIQADLTASFIIMDKLLIGAMFRTGDAFGALVGINVTEQLHFGYSFDYSYGLQTFKYNQGSHELVLRYDFIFSSKKQIHSPRNF
jgi:type IX secretion system PorP/SprF family membrane protein